MLLGAGADHGSRDIYQNTALIQASRNGYASIVKLLLTAGADDNVVDIVSLILVTWHSSQSDVVD